MMGQETITSVDGTPVAYWRSGEGPYLVHTRAVTGAA
jgi:hypothetical protein